MLHVVPFEYPLGGVELGGTYVDTWPERLAEANARLDGFLADEFRGISVKRVVLDGDPAVMIVQTAHSEGADLIVMPTHGYGPFRRFILGSVTAKVLHDADCPVFTGVHLEEGPREPASLFRSILCAVDLGPQSQRVLAWAAGLAGELNAHLHVVHALPEAQAGGAEYLDQGWRINLERSARETVAKLLGDSGTPAKIVLDSGDVSKVVRNAAATVEADLVVIGRHADSGILGRLRTHSYAIIRESPCPVISV
jgi:nucleotide-binding universal stress UspA family protein